MRRALAVVGAGMLALGALVHALGWTDSLAVVSLTAPAGETFEVAVAKSAAVLLSAFAAVVVAPVALLTAATWWLVDCRWPHR